MIETPQQRAERRRRNIKRRLIAYGTIFSILYLAFLWIPWEYDLIERVPPTNVAQVDPDSTRLFREGTPVLLVTAHPDDSEFYIGVTLNRLGKSAIIDQVIVTDGDKSYYGPFTDAAGNRRVRRREATDALKAWGGRSIEFLGYPDGRLRANDDVINDLADVITRLQPEYILTFDPDFPARARHGDHRKTGVATIAAAKRAGFTGWLLLYSTVAPNFVLDVTSDWEVKRELVGIHESQFPSERLDMIMNMVASQAERHGAVVDVPLGEGFRAVRLQK